MTEHNRFSTKQHALNLASSVVNLLLVAGSGLLLLPIALHTLTISQYSYVPAILGVSQAITQVIAAVSSTLNRYYAVAVQSADRRRAAEIFSTLNIALLAMSGALTVFAFGFATGAPRWLQAPQDLYPDLSLMTFFMMASTAVVAIDAGLSAASFSRNRLDLRNLAQISGRSLYLLFAVGLLSLIGGQLAFFGVALFAGSLCTLFLTYMTLSRFPDARVSAQNFSWGTLKEVGGRSSWVLLNQIGAAIFLYADLLVINYRWGPETGGIFGALYQILFALRAVALTAIFVLVPHATYLFATSGKSHFFSFIARLQRFSSFGAVAAVTVIGLLAWPGLFLWVGPQIASHSELLVLLLLMQAPFLAAIPTVSALPIINRVAVPAIVTLCSALMFLTAAFLVPLEYGAISIAVMSTLLLFGKNVLWNALDLGKQLKQNAVPMIRSTAVAILLSSLPAAALFSGEPAFQAPAALLAITAGWFLILNNADRNMLLDGLAHAASTVRTAFIRKE